MTQAVAMPPVRGSAATTDGAIRREKVKSVVRVAAGNFLEMYDFMIYGYYAAAIGRAFFPKSSEFASLMLSLGTFGAGFLMRPLGALTLGAYLDRHGRRAGLILTLALMSVGTLSIALAPPYAAIGLLAPLIVVVGRLIQGLSAGVELGGVSVYLSEIATPGRTGFYVSWQSASQQLAVVFAALVGVGLHGFVSAAQMDAWGWRVPLLIGCAIIPLVFLIRRSLTETDAFARRTSHPSIGDIVRSVAANWRLVLSGCTMMMLTTVAFYTITAYTPTFGRSALHLDEGDVLIVTLCGGLSNFIWLPVMGALSDRIGRRPLLIAFALVMLLTAYPALAWLSGAVSFSNLLMVELWLSFLYGGYNGAMVVHLTEIMPAHVRASGFSLAYSLATALFGGFTPMIATYLIEVTGNTAMPGVWLSCAALVSLVSVLAPVGHQR
jgi:MFS transporter, MHS family, citrate/tricarballylate:H+ symporter